MYFKDRQNNLHYIDNEDEKSFLPDGLAEISDEEAKEILAARQPSADQLKLMCKSLAKQKLEKTDWVEIPSVTNTTNDPHLSNIEDFLRYRNEIRKLVVYPVENPNWPAEPSPVWTSAGQ